MRCINRGLTFGTDRYHLPTMPVAKKLPKLLRASEAVGSCKNFLSNIIGKWFR